MFMSESDLSSVRARTAREKYASFAAPSDITETFDNMAQDTDVQAYSDIVLTEVDHTVHPNVRPASFLFRLII
jgi:hypothetical protein